MLSALLFTVLVLAVCLVWIPKGILPLPISPRIFNLPVIFSFLFLLYYTQSIFVYEVILKIPVKQWLPLSEVRKSEALSFLLLYLLIFWFGILIHSRKNYRTHRISKPNYQNSGLIVACIALVSLVIYIAATGGLHQFITNHREAVYANQWSQSSQDLAVSRIRILTNFAMTVAGILGGYYLATHESANLWQKSLYVLLPLPATLVKLVF